VQRVIKTLEICVIQKLDLQNRNWSISQIKHWADGGDLLLSPPYQRGDVWGTKRRQNFIRSLLQGIPVPSVVMNDRLRADFVGDRSTSYSVIDGKQRITTILMFFAGELLVPADWFDLVDCASNKELVSFPDLTKRGQRRFENLPFACAETYLTNEADEQVVFDLINFGGLAQGEVDQD
jgi:uncharacterized protein with ParB-like and HNH nuclease domain